MEQKIKESFFTKDPTFYRTLFPLLITVALQNIDGIQREYGG